MSSVDMSDPHITMAYDAITHNDPLRWFLLGFGKKPNALQVVARGTGDIDELCSHIDPEHISYGLFREPTRDKTLRLSINHIPNSLKGVHRAKALVHGKFISNRFTSHEVLTVSKPEEVTVQALRSTLRLPPRRSQLNGSTSDNLPSPPKPVPPQTTPSHPISSPPISSPPISSPPISSPPISSPPISSRPNGPKPSPPQPLSASPPHQPSRTVHRKPIPNMEPPIASEILIAQAFLETTEDSEDDVSKLPSNAHLPSPIVSELPPKDDSFASAGPALPTPDTTSPTNIPPWLAKQAAPLPPPPNEPGDSDSQSSHNKSEGSWARPASPDIQSIPDSASAGSSPPSVHSSPGLPTHDEPEETIASQDLPGKSFEPEQSTSRLPKSLPSVPVPSTSSGQPQRDSFDSITSDRRPSGSSLNTSPTGRKASIFKSRILTPAEEEEERKLAVLEEERRRRQAEKIRRDKEEREEEEARQREFEERREKERLRRLESARRAEQQRAEIKQRQQEEEAKRKVEQQRKEEEAMRRRKNIGEQLAKNSGAGMELMSGFITMEYGSQWKRRYYRLCTEQWEFYKDDEELANPVQLIDLPRVTALKEWHEGYEELEAIPYSFAVELQDDVPCLFFADSSEDKEIILGLLHQAAGL